MKRRWSLTAALLLVLLALAAAWPLCRFMSEAAARGKLSDKQRAVAQALEAQTAYEALGTGDAVLPLIEVEDAWAIEDTREEAQEPLVAAMYSGADALGCDALRHAFIGDIVAGYEKEIRDAATLTESLSLQDGAFTYCVASGAGGKHFIAGGTLSREVQP